MGFPFKSPPDPIQISALQKAWKKPAYAFFHAMGAGKTYTNINLAAARHLKGQIKHLIVIVNPGALKDVWEVELEKHCPCEYDVYLYRTGKQGAYNKWWTRVEKKDCLKVLVFGIEAFSQGNIKHTLANYIDHFRDEGIMMTIDESTGIKNFTSTRSKTITDNGHKCQYRTILTGTPLTQGPQDLYSQFYYLDPKIIGLTSYVKFRNMYCVMGGFENRKIVDYQRLDELFKLVEPYCDIVTKEEALPELCKKYPKQYLPDIIVEPTSEQKKAFKQLEDEFMAESEGDTLTVSTVMERLLRYQQICGGFFPFDEEDEGYSIKAIPGRNPKLEALLADLSICYEAGEKTIIWARFVPEVELIRDALARQYGDDSVVSFYGGIPEEERGQVTKTFQEDERCRFIISTAVVGGKGQTWTMATQTRYYSNTFSYEDRYQSEDRNHRRGTKNSVGYKNIIMNIRADKMIIQAVAKKHDLAEEFKDGVKNINLGEA